MIQRIHAISARSRNQSFVPPRPVVFSPGDPPRVWQEVKSEPALRKLQLGNIPVFVGDSSHPNVDDTRLMEIEGDLFKAVISDLYGCSQSIPVARRIILLALLNGSPETNTLLGFVKCWYNEIKGRSANRKVRFWSRDVAKEAAFAVHYSRGPKLNGHRLRRQHRS